jgi:hypothetical protein
VIGVSGSVLVIVITITIFNTILVDHGDFFNINCFFDTNMYVDGRVFLNCFGIASLYRMFK